MRSLPWDEHTCVSKCLTPMASTLCHVMRNKPWSVPRAEGPQLSTPNCHHRHAHLPSYLHTLCHYVHTILWSSVVLEASRILAREEIRVKCPHTWCWQPCGTRSINRGVKRLRPSSQSVEWSLYRPRMHEVQCLRLKAHTALPLQGPKTCSFTAIPWCWANGV